MFKITRSLVLMTFIITQLFTGNVSMAAVTTTEVVTGNNAASAVVIGNDGFARIAFYANTSQELKFVQCTNLSCSTSVGPEILETTDLLTGGPAMVLGDDGYPRISYKAGGNLKYVQCQNDACSTNVVSTVDNSANSVGDNSSIAIDSNGYAVITYYDSTDDDLEIAQCTNDACSTANLNTVDATNDKGKFSSIALLSDDTPLIAYYDETDDDLEYVKCGNATCSSGNSTTTLLSTGSQGGGVSLKLTDAGLPRLVSIDGTNDLMLYILCDQDDCAGSNTTTETASNLSDNPNPTLEFDSDGLARFSYNDNGYFARYTKCGNADCTNYSDHNFGTTSGAGTSMALTASDLPFVTRHESNNLYAELCGNPGCGDDFTATLTLSNSNISATDTIYSIIFTPTVTLNSGSKIKVTFPGNYDLTTDGITDADVSVSGTNITSSSETISGNTITSTLTTSADVSTAITMTIGDGGGSLNDLTNPGASGAYNINIDLYDIPDDVLDTGEGNAEVATGTSVTVIITEAIVMTLDSTSIALQVDPSVNGGEDKSEGTILTVASNASGGYSIYGSLDDGSGNAQLVSGANSIASSTGENGFSYDATNNASSCSSPDGSKTFAASAAVLQNGSSQDVGYTEETDLYQHAICYDLNVNYNTPAGVYTGTVTYTIVASF